MIRLFVFSEASLPGLLWQAAMGQRPVSAGVLPLLRPLHGLLVRLEAWMLRKRLVQSLAEAFPDMPWIEGTPGRGYYNDIHHRIEVELHRHFDGGSGDLAYAFKKATTDAVQAVVPLPLACEWLAANRERGTWRLEGAPTFLHDVACMYYGQVPDWPVRILRLPVKPVNFLNALLVWAGVSLWLLLRTRLKVETLKFCLAVDRMSPLDDQVLSRVLDDPREALVIDRLGSLAAAQGVRGGWQKARLCDARLQLSDLPGILSDLTTAIWGLWRKDGEIDPLLFGRRAALSGKQIMFRAFFRRFKPSFFWGRDDYSLEHVVRNIELKKIGGRSLGINHGLAMNTFAPQWREIMFDIYYVYGRHMYETYQKDAWWQGMTVRPIGNLHCPHDERRGDRAQKRDIGYFAMSGPYFEFLLREVFKVARHFSGRTVHVRMKPGRERHFMDLFERLMQEAPANVRNHQEPDPYGLLTEIGYALTSGSTLTAEALQFGATTFCFDVDPSLECFYYRDFPGLTVPDAATVIRRIEDIESGHEKYDFMAYDGLISMSAGDPFDVIRQDIGLSSTGRIAA
ncbi:MAG: hypothetical protein EPN26_01420 [Rhodospirillales bacterium]|nr:MAG: hypothetical protein EPN26_01420 [Rhodospirillales bacterium]